MLWSSGAPHILGRSPGALSDPKHLLGLMIPVHTDYKPFLFYNPALELQRGTGNSRSLQNRRYFLAFCRRARRRAQNTRRARIERESRATG